MKQTVRFKFCFKGIGGVLNQEWYIKATHIYIEHPTFDLLGDPATLPDIEERLCDIKIMEATKGNLDGVVQREDIPTELFLQIIEQGKKIGMAQLKAFFKPTTNRERAESETIAYHKEKQDRTFGPEYETFTK